MVTVWKKMLPFVDLLSNLNLIWGLNEYYIITETSTEKRNLTFSISNRRNLCFLKEKWIFLNNLFRKLEREFFYVHGTVSSNV